MHVHTNIKVSFSILCTFIQISKSVSQFDARSYKYQSQFLNLMHVHTNIKVSFSIWCTFLQISKSVSQFDARSYKYQSQFLNLALNRRGETNNV